MLSWFKKKRKEAVPATEQQNPVAEPSADLSPSTEESFAQQKESSLPQTPAPGNALSRPDSEEEKTTELLHDTTGEEPAMRTEEQEFSRQESGHSKKGSFFSRLSERLDKTKESFTYQLDTILLGKKEIDANLLEDLEELLITADLGVATSEELLETIRRRVKRSELTDPDKLKNVLKQQIMQYMAANAEDAGLVMPEKGPFVIMVIGVNGVGKTTTIGKIANKFLKSGRSVMLAAGDTFRAAAVSQLKIWGERNGVPVVAHREGADPSSVVFDALSSAIAKDIDVLLVDTAGRMHTKDNLMEELKKIKRVMAKKLPTAPHETLLVLDATTGQNGLSQARLFDDAVAVTGLALTKLDGTSKGGIVINICKEMKIPLRFIGIGEQLDDLRDFDAEEFVNALFTEKQ